MSGGAPREGLRRAIHLLTGSGIAAGCYTLPARVVSLSFVALLFIALVFEIARRRSPTLEAALERLTLGAMRPAETRAITGASVLALGFALSWFLFPAGIAGRAILVAATADPAAAVVGTRKGPRGRKTLAGSAAALVTAFVVLALTGVAPLTAGIVALVAAAAERIPGPAVDNLSLPLGVAVALRVLS